MTTARPGTTVLGADVSLNSPGFAVVGSDLALVEGTNPVQKAGGEAGPKLLALAAHVRGLVRVHAPVLLVLESSRGRPSRSGATADALPLTRGVIWGAVGHRTRIVEVSPQAARSIFKRGWRGGTSGKEEVMAYLAALGYTLPTRKNGQVNDDIADALFLGLYGHNLIVTERLRDGPV